MSDWARFALRVAIAWGIWKGLTWATRSNQQEPQQ